MNGLEIQYCAILINEEETSYLFHTLRIKIGQGKAKQGKTLPKQN